MINVRIKGTQKSYCSVYGGGGARLLFQVGGGQAAPWIWHLRRHWRKRIGCVMTAPQFLSLELISIGTRSHTLLPPDLSLWMSQDKSHSTCPVPPLKPLSPQHTLILPYLSHLSQWHHLPRCSSQAACESVYPSSSLDYVVQIHPPLTCSPAISF